MTEMEGFRRATTRFRASYSMNVIKSDKCRYFGLLYYRRGARGLGPNRA